MRFAFATALALVAGSSAAALPEDVPKPVDVFWYAQLFTGTPAPQRSFSFSVKGLEQAKDNGVVMPPFDAQCWSNGYKDVGEPVKCTSIDPKDEAKYTIKAKLLNTDSQVGLKIQVSFQWKTDDGKHEYEQFGIVEPSTIQGVTSGSLPISLVFLG